MKKIFSFILLMGLIGACSSATKSTQNADNPNRAPQQVSEDAGDEEQANEQSFMKLIDRKSPVETAVEVQSFLERQMQHTYAIQGLVRQFDQELDKLYAMKKRDVDTDPDQKNLDEIKLKLSAAWELYERHLHTMSHIYIRLREEASKAGGPFQTGATYALNSMKSYVDSNWKSGDHWALLSMIEDFRRADEDFESKNPHQPKLAFMSYYSKKLNRESEIAEAKAQSIRFQKNRKKNKADQSFLQDWNKYIDRRMKELQAERARDRQPNTDVLYPSPGGNGHITGNMFKTGFWAITFDDGPHPTYTQGMIDAMNSGGYEGTFFWLTQNIKLYKAQVEKAAAEGFKRGSHSYTHANLPTLGDKALNHEINEAYDGFQDVVGQPPTLFRCPYGACGGANSKIRKMIADKKMMHVFWNVDSLDWQDKDPASIFARVKKQMEVNGKGIVLFHDIHPQSVKAVQLMVNWISNEKKAWKLLTMDRMIQEETANSNSPSKNYQSP